MGDLAALGDARNTAAGRKLGRLADLFRRRGAPAYRMAPPLRNPHYVGLHIAVASGRSAVR
jgi:hypothetical protein